MGRRRDVVSTLQPQPGKRDAGCGEGTAKIELMSEKQIKEIARLGKLMVDHTKNLEFEKAGQLRDQFHIPEVAGVRGAWDR